MSSSTYQQSPTKKKYIETDESEGERFIQTPNNRDKDEQEDTKQHSLFYKKHQTNSDKTNKTKSDVVNKSKSSDKKKSLDSFQQIIQELQKEFQNKALKRYDTFASFQNGIVQRLNDIFSDTIVFRLKKKNETGNRYLFWCVLYTTHKFYCSIGIHLIWNKTKKNVYFYKKLEEAPQDLNISTSDDDLVVFSEFVNFLRKPDMIHYEKDLKEHNFSVPKLTSHILNHRLHISNDANDVIMYNKQPPSPPERNERRHHQTKHHKTHHRKPSKVINRNPTENNKHKRKFKRSNTKHTPRHHLHKKNNPKFFRKNKTKTSQQKPRNSPVNIKVSSDQEWASSILTSSSEPDILHSK